MAANPGRGLDPKAFFAAIADQRFKGLLRSNTEELISRGGYGSPTMYVNGGDIVFRQRPPAADRAQTEATFVGVTVQMILNRISC